MSQFRGAKNGGFYGSNISQPIKIDCNFIVDHANGNGLGIRSLKSNGWIRNVFMNTSVTPGVNNNATNPNPIAGFALIQFKQNFNLYIGGSSGFVSPPTGSTTSTTAGHAYIIHTLGTTTLAQWNTAGLPAGLVPAVNQSFIAIATGALGGTGSVFVPSISGITSVEIVGDPNQSISNSSIAANGGAYVLVQFLAPTNTTTTTLIPTAPTDNSVVALSFYFDQSSADVLMVNGDPANS